MTSPHDIPPSGGRGGRLPPIAALGHDLLVVTRRQRVVSVARPLVCFALYWVFAALGWWALAVTAVAALMFVTYASTSHDLVHETLGFSKRTGEVLLAIIEGLTLRSGHAFRQAHRYHHQRFPHEDDLEGAAAHGSWWRALLRGPLYQPTMWWWAWRRSAGRPVERRWLAAEAAWIMAVLGAGVVLWRTWPSLAVYAGLVVSSSWLYPFVLAYVPHVVDPRGPLFQTRLFRGRMVPALLLQHTFHLEHHLYPMVSSHHWRELGRRLEGHFRDAGLKPIRIP